MSRRKIVTLLCQCGHPKDEHHASWVPGIATKSGKPLELVEECEFWDEPCDCQAFRIPKSSG